MSSENNMGTGDRGVNSTVLANSTLVYSVDEPLSGQTAHTSTVEHTPDSISQWRSSPSETPTPPNGLQSLWQSFEERGISSKATTIILQSWATGTQKQYQPYIEKWLQFCAKCSLYDPPVNIVLDFLVTLYEQNLEYTTINTARSAISAITLLKDNTTVGHHPVVSRFMKGIFRSKPPKPRYETTWDVEPVLRYLSSLGTPSTMNLKTLSMKLVMLVALVTAQRGQSLHVLDINFMKQDESMFEFLLPEHVKQSRPGYTPPTVILSAFPSDKTLCVFSHMKTYIDCTSTLEGKETKLFISYIKPHHRYRVSRDTISRWIRETMTNAGVDTSIFKPQYLDQQQHQDILGRAGWSSSRTFDKFFNKPAYNKDSFATAVLHS